MGGPEAIVKEKPQIRFEDYGFLKDETNMLNVMVGRANRDAAFKNKPTNLEEFVGVLKKAMGMEGRLSEREKTIQKVYGDGNAQVMDGVNRKIGTIRYLVGDGFSLDEVRALASVATYLNESALKDRPTSIYEIIKVLENPKNADARGNEMLNACRGVETPVMESINGKVAKLKIKEEAERKEFEEKELASPKRK